MSGSYVKQSSPFSIEAVAVPLLASSQILAVKVSPKSGSSKGVQITITLSSGKEVISIGVNTGVSLTGCTVITTMAVSQRTGFPLSHTSYVIVSIPTKSVGGV